MTPALTAVYDELLLRAAAPPFQEEARRLRAAWELRTGAVPSDHPARTARDAASWEDALVAGGLGLRVAATLDDPAERSLALVFTRAQRGLFVPVRRGAAPCVRDLWRGGEFLLLGRDDISRGLDEVQGIGFVGRLVAGADGCAVLPGRIWLPQDALPLLPPLIEQARARAMDTDAFAEALLWMEHLLCTMSRVKPSYAFRAEGLDHRVPAPRR